MSVRDSLLAVLTLGPAYGAQLHTEVLARLGHRRSLNIGQVYTTLDRLVTQRLLRPAGVTDDGLPLYGLTDAGSAAAARWLGDASAAGTDWSEMLDQVLVASSLPGVAAQPLVDAHRAAWRLVEGTSARGSAQDVLAAEAVRAQASAALAWLDAVERSLGEGDERRGYSEERPRRGRRPAA